MGGKFRVPLCTYWAPCIYLFLYKKLNFNSVKQLILVFPVTIYRFSRFPEIFRKDLCEGLRRSTLSRFSLIFLYLWSRPITRLHSTPCAAGEHSLIYWEGALYLAYICQLSVRMMYEAERTIHFTSAVFFRRRVGGLLPMGVVAKFVFDTFIYMPEQPRSVLH